MRYSNIRNKIYFIYLGEMFRLDPDDKLEMLEHEMLENTICIVNHKTCRYVQVQIHTKHEVMLDYVDALGELHHQPVCDPTNSAKRTIDFLNGVTKKI